jgi:dTMP kinase
MAEAGRAPGRFITVEGVEGSGKSTQAARLVEWLRGRGLDVVATSEPDGTAVGRGVRGLLAQAGGAAPLTEALLFSAARAEHVRQVLGPALGAGRLVVCDRYVDSTTAYQGAGRGVPPETLAALARAATGGLQPDLTLVLDLDVAEGLRRARSRAGRADAFEQLPLEFHERVRKAYWAIQAREPERVVLVDAARPLDEVTRRIRSAVGEHLGLGER